MHSTSQVTTMIAEHGPPNYQQTLPHSRQPVCHIWDANHWIILRRQVRLAGMVAWWCGLLHSSRLCGMLNASRPSYHGYITLSRRVSPSSSARKPPRA